MVDLGLLVLRLGLGIMFFAHGLQMALGRLGGPGVKGFAVGLAKMGFVNPLGWSYLACYTVLIGGGHVDFWGGRKSCLGVLVHCFIATAAVTVHISKGFFISQGGFEYNFVIACGCIALILAGPGKFSRDEKVVTQSPCRERKIHPSFKRGAANQRDAFRASCILKPGGGDRGAFHRREGEALVVLREKRNSCAKDLPFTVDAPSLVYIPPHTRIT